MLSREGDYLFATVNGVKTLIGYEGNERELILPDGNYTLAPYLFYREKTIKRVIVPNTVSINDDTVFSQCEALEMILVSGGSAPSSWIDGWNSKTAFVEGYTGLDNTYTFHTEGEAITPVTAVGPITLPKPVLDGYVFMGWYDNDSFLGEAYTGLYYSADKTDLYAKFMLESDYIELYLRGQSMEYAYEIVSGSKYPVKINSKKAQNYYAITVSAGDVLNILTDESSGSHKIWIYDENGNVIMEYDSRTTYHVDYDYTFTKAGTYYIGVGYKGDATGSFGVKFTEK